jgi:hypothetical protein
VFELVAITIRTGRISWGVTERDILMDLFRSRDTRLQRVMEGSMGVRGGARGLEGIFSRLNRCFLPVVRVLR